jgi:hypothetical protein
MNTYRNTGFSFTSGTSLTTNGIGICLVVILGRRRTSHCHRKASCCRRVRQNDLRTTLGKVECKVIGANRARTRSEKAPTTRKVHWVHSGSSVRIWNWRRWRNKRRNSRWWRSTPTATTATTATTARRHLKDDLRNKKKLDRWEWSSESPAIRCSLFLYCSDLHVCYSCSLR